MVQRPNEEGHMRTLTGFCTSLKSRPSGQRDGQYLVNALWAYDREAGEKVHGTEADCFYDDTKILSFWKKLGEIYEKKEI